MTYLVGGGLLGLLIGAGLDASTSGMWACVIVGALVVNLGSCVIWPYRRCWRCDGRRRREDGEGNYGDRSCLVCGGQPYLRLGARLMGRGE